jgi:hypothetical protein
MGNVSSHMIQRRGLWFGPEHQGIAISEILQKDSFKREWSICLLRRKQG